MKTLETNEKIESLRKEIGNTKKSKMQILELKITKAKIKIKKSVNGLNRRMEGTEERISELKGT